MKIDFTPLGEQSMRVEFLDEVRGREIQINFMFRIDSIKVTVPCLMEFLF